MDMAHAAQAFEIGQKYHQFEIAGLGKAPYVFLGVEKRVYCACQGAPAQPGSTCDYCGTGIMLLYWLRSAVGREFKVGCDCILKTNSDRALRVAVENAKQQHDREMREARAEKKRIADLARINAAKERLSEIAEKLRAEPHPMAASGPFFAGKTRLDWAEWMLEHAGMSGRLSVARAIESLL
jgi:hypothetical protein